MGILMDIIGSINNINYENNGKESSLSIKVNNERLNSAIKSELPYDAKEPILIEEKEENLNDNIEVIDD